MERLHVEKEGNIFYCVLKLIKRAYEQFFNVAKENRQILPHPHFS